MNKEELMNNLYDIITNNIDELQAEEGANIWLTTDNELYIQVNDTEQVFVLNAKEFDENGTTKN